MTLSSSMITLVMADGGWKERSMRPRTRTRMRIGVTGERIGEGKKRKVNGPGDE